MDAQTDNTPERDTDTAASAGSDAGSGKQPGKRGKLLAAVVGVLLAAGAVYGSYWAILAPYTETTDNAYVGGNVVQITPQVTGTVVAISVDDTDFVRAGQPLIQLDRADAEVAMQRAQAQLAQTIREVRGLYADTACLQAAVAVRKVELAKARDDLARREKLGNSGAVSNEAIQHARDAVHTGQASLQVAQQQLAANRALTEAAVDTHDRSDSRLLPGAHREPVYQTRVFDEQRQAAYALVARIIAANLTVKGPSGGSTQTTVAGGIAGQVGAEPVHVARQVPLVSRDGS